MKNYILIVLLLHVLFCVSNSNNPVKISFTENKGQVGDQNSKPRKDVLFSGTDGKMLFHIRKSGISYQLNRVESYKYETNRNQQSVQIPDEVSIYRIDANWKGCNSEVKIETEGCLSSYSNYYSEVCPNGVTHVRSFTDVTIKEIYNNISVHYYENNGVLKCDYIVAPGGNYKQIKIEISGAEIKTLKDGSLEYITPLGTIKEGAPLVYQGGKLIKSSWVVIDNVLSFYIPHYNPSLPLIIDPATRVWGTYYGGAGFESAYASTVDGDNNFYLAGNTSTGTGTVIATSGAFQTIMSGASDAFLAKFNSAGVRKWATYYGGNSSEAAYGCSSDKGAFIYLCGVTSSSIAISTPGAYQVNLSLTPRDAFLAQFDTTGVRIWGTYYGGASAWEDGFSVSANKFGDVFLAGDVSTPSSPSSTVLISPGCHQASFGGSSDCFLAKFDYLGNRAWGTYYGGATVDGFTSCSSDRFGNVYLSGKASSVSNIASPGAFKPTISGSSDAFVAKFNSLGVRKWGTYYGGSNDEWGRACATDPSGNIFIVGYVPGNSIGLTSSGAHQTSFSGGTYDAFLGKFDSTGVRKWSTYFGNNGADQAYACATDTAGYVYIAGNTTSTGTGWFVTAGSHQTTFGGGSTFGDGFLARFDPNGKQRWGTFYGGSGDEDTRACSADLFGSVYLSGSSTSTVANAISTVGGHQQVYGGGSSDAYLVKFDMCTNNSVTISSSTLQTCSGNTVSIGVFGGDTYTLNPGNVSIMGSSTVVTPTATTTYTISSLVTGCSSVFENTITINTVPSPTLGVGVTPTLICVGQTATLSATGSAATYSWTPGGAGQTITVSPSTSVNYTVTATAANNCRKSDTISLFVSPCTNIESYNGLELFIYPNPANNIIYIEQINNREVLFYGLTDITGKELIRKRQIISIKEIVDVSEYAKGIYFLQISTANGQCIVKKIVKE